MLSDRAIQIIAENKIQAAIDAGEFDNLPGFGKPAAICDGPYDPHWWIRRKLRQEQIRVNLIGYEMALMETRSRHENRSS